MATLQGWMGVAAALVLAGCQPQDRTTVLKLTGSENLVWKSYTMAAGATLEVEFDASVNPDCTPTVAQGTLRMIGEPSHGKLTIEKTESFPNFKHGDPRWQCNKKRVSGALALYRPDDGFVGEDTFKYDHYTADGQLLHMRAVVTVQ